MTDTEHTTSGSNEEEEPVETNEIICKLIEHQHIACNKITSPLLNSLIFI